SIRQPKHAGEQRKQGNVITIAPQPAPVGNPRHPAQRKCQHALDEAHMVRTKRSKNCGKDKGNAGVDDGCRRMGPDNYGQLAHTDACAPTEAARACSTPSTAARSEYCSSLFRAFSPI